MGYSDGQRYHQYLQSGQETAIQRLALFGYPVPQQGKKYFSGALVGDQTRPEASEVNTFLTSETRHAAQLYQTLTSHQKQIQYFGFDIDVVAGGAYEDLLVLCESEAFKQKIIQVQELELAEAIQALADLRQHLSDFCIPKQHFSDISLSLKVLYESLVFASIAYFNPELEVLLKMYAQREHTMFALIDHFIEHSAEQDRFVLMGHNMHLLKDHQAMRFGDLTESQTLWPTVGEYIYQQYPEQTLAIWMLFNQGEHSAPPVFAPTIAPQDNTIESIFAEFGQAFLLPITADSPLLNEPQLYVCNNGTFASGSLSKAADLIYFKKEVSPA